MSSTWADSNFLYRKEIKIYHNFISSNTINLPVLVDLQDPDLLPIYMSGHCTSMGGFDILFYTKGDEEGLVTPTLLNHEIELYDYSSCRQIFWVKLPYISSSEYCNDTSFYLYYNNPGITSNQSTKLTWSDYGYVWHFNSLLDYIANSGMNCPSGQNIFVMKAVPIYTEPGESET
jgi:hypothetical protein